MRLHGLSPEKGSTWQSAGKPYFSTKYGLMGPTTRGAMHDAKAAFGLGAVGDRVLFDHLESVTPDPSAE